MRSRLALIIALLGLIVALSGCGGGEAVPTTQAPSATDGPAVGSSLQVIVEPSLPVTVETPTTLQVTLRDALGNGIGDAVRVAVRGEADDAADATPLFGVAEESDGEGGYTVPVVWSHLGRWTLTVDVELVNGESLSQVVTVQVE